MYNLVVLRLTVEKNVFNVCEIQPFWAFELPVDLRLSARQSGSWWEICISSREVCVPQKHGSEFPDIDSFSDFADLVSDMSRKGN